MKEKKTANKKQNFNRDRDFSKDNSSKEIIRKVSKPKGTVKPPCKYFRSCGGCNLLCYDYKTQLQRKMNAARMLLGKYGKVSEILGMDDPYYYRNKVHATFSTDRKGEIIAGIYEEKTHKVVNIDNCMIQDKRANAVILTIKELVKSFKIQTYNEDRELGFLRHVLIRTGHATKQMMVVLVAGSTFFKSKKAFIKVLKEKHPEITTIVLNINDKNTSMVLGSRQEVLYGNGYIEDRLMGKTFRISPKSFYQINSIQTEKLYQKAVDFADLKGREIVLDAYCGIGTIGIIASKRAKKVIGVEINKDGVKDAIYNAKLNHIKNIRFEQKDAGDFMVELARNKQKIDVVIMDPPRSGSDEKFINSLLELQPKKIVYISCDLETLARDLEMITNDGYKVQAMQPVDMFCMTNHVEMVVMITKCDSKGKK